MATRINGSDDLDYSVASMARNDFFSRIIHHLFLYSPYTKWLRALMGEWRVWIFDVSMSQWVWSYRFSIVYAHCWWCGAGTVFAFSLCQELGRWGKRASWKCAHGHRHNQATIFANNLAPSGIRAEGRMCWFHSGSKSNSFCSCLARFVRINQT